MNKVDFMILLNGLLHETGMDGGYFNNVFMTVGDKREENTTVYIDEENYIWLTENESLIRIMTPVNVDHVVDFRFGAFGPLEERFFVICDDYSGLEFCEGDIYYFRNGDYGKSVKATALFASILMNSADRIA